MFSQIPTLEWSNGIENIGNEIWNFGITSNKFWIAIGNQCQQICDPKCGTIICLKLVYLLLLKKSTFCMNSNHNNIKCKEPKPNFVNIP